MNCVPLPINYVVNTINCVGGLMNYVPLPINYVGHTINCVRDTNITLKMGNYS